MLTESDMTTLSAMFLDDMSGLLKKEREYTTEMFKPVNMNLEMIVARLERLETRMTSLETRMTGVETRMTGVETRMTGVETQVTRLVQMDEFERRLKAIEEKWAAQ